MLAQAKATWKELKGSPVGHRFEMHYHRERTRRGKSSPLRSVVTWAAAVAAIAVGIVLVFIPGPAFVFFGIAGALLATQSIWVAKALDWVELEARAIVRVALRWWGRRSGLARVSLLVAIGCVIAAAGVGAFTLLFKTR